MKYENKYNILAEIKEHYQILKNTEVQIEREIQYEFEELRSLPENYNLSDKEIYAAAMIRHFERTCQ
jgi:hypothetical protein